MNFILCFLCALFAFLSISCFGIIIMNITNEVNIKYGRITYQNKVYSVKLEE